MMFVLSSAVPVSGSTQVSDWLSSVTATQNRNARIEMRAKPRHNVFLEVIRTSGYATKTGMAKSLVKSSTQNSRRRSHRKSLSLPR